MPDDEVSEKPIELRAKVASGVRQVIFQAAENVVRQELFEESLRPIDALRP